MGVLSSKIYIDEETGYRQADMLLWGEVVQDARLSYTKHKHCPKVEISVKYSRNKYMRVTSLGDYQQTAVASRLEKGDYVLCAGLWEERPYKNKDGEEKFWSELKISAKLNGFISPLGQVQSAEMGEATEEGPTASALGSFQEVDDGEDGELPW